MPERTADAFVADYPIPKNGVNLRKNVVDLDPTEALSLQNLIWTDGMTKRGGQSTVTEESVVGGKKVRGLHRYYKSDGTNQLLAAAGTTVKYLNGTSWSNVVTGLTDDQEVHMTTWGGVDKVYISNGTDELYSWDGSSAVTLSGGNIPSSIIQTLPYQDRLLAIDDTNPGTLTWSDSFSDTAANWIAASTTNVKPDSRLFGMTYHSLTNSSSGLETKVILAGSNGMYVFSGTVLSGTTDYTIYPLAIRVGCESPRTMIWTPVGTMWLGVDKMVYLLPFNSATPIPVGTKISAAQGNVTGIEDIPAGQLSNASAVYHEGYYKLSITKSSGTYNTEQWWLDVSRLQIDENRHYGPWFGPMKGWTIGPMVSLTGGGDAGQLYGGDASGNGLVYEIDKIGTYSDVSNVTSYDNKSKDVGDRGINPQAVSFKTDGTKMYTLDSGNDTVYQYSLSVAFDVSSASYDSVSFSVTAEESTPIGLAFKPDGTKMYITGQAENKVFQYSLTAWDLSTASYDTVSFDFSGETATGVSAIRFKPDGTKMYLLAFLDDKIFQYSLSSAWVVSSASYDSVSFSVSQDSSPVDIDFKTDGTKMYLAGSVDDKIYQYSLNAWDLSTLSYDSVSFGIGSQDVSPAGLAFKPDGTKMYMVALTNNTVYQYSPASTWDIETTNKEITCQWQTFYNPLNAPQFRKQVPIIEAEFLDTSDTVSVTFKDITGVLKSATNFNLETEGIKWGEHNWGTFNWNDFDRIRKTLSIDPVIFPRRLSMLLTNSSDTNNFKVFSLMAKAIEQDMDFEA